MYKRQLLNSSFEPGDGKKTVESFSDPDFRRIAEAELYYFSGEAEKCEEITAVSYTHLSMMVPGQLGIIGLFKLCNNLGLLNTYWPLILPCIANSSTIFFILQYLQSSMSEELLDSARIDGAGEVKIFHSFILRCV